MLMMPKRTGRSIADSFGAVFVLFFVLSADLEADGATLEAVNGTIHEINSLIGSDISLPCTGPFYHTLKQSGASNTLRHRPQHSLTTSYSSGGQGFIVRTRRGHFRTGVTERPILVLWYKDGVGTPIYSFDSRTSSGRTWIDSELFGGRAVYNVSLGKLLIKNVQSGDNGLYRCRVDYRNAATKVTRTSLTVIVAPSSPKISDSTSEGDGYGSLGPYNEGDRLTIDCTVNGGRPQPKLLWYIGNRMLDDKYESKDDVTTNSLVVTSADRTLVTESLRCVATVPKMMPLEASVTLIVNLKPSVVKILGPKPALTATKSYDIDCEVAGSKPKATVLWYLDDEKLSSHSTVTHEAGNVTVSTLRYEPKEEDEKKTLRCEGFSPAMPQKIVRDQWTLLVNFMPIARLSMGRALDAQSIKAGDDVFLECRMRAKPWIHRLLWMHNGQEVRHNVSVGVIISNQSLVLQHVTRRQGGDYTCVGYNSEGEGRSAPLTLNIKYAPVCSENQAYIYDAARNEEVTVGCKLDAYPSDVSFRWRFNNSGEMVDISAEHIKTKHLTSSLSYVARTDLDYGTLLCWGNNSLGSQVDPCIFKVVPAELPNPPTNCSIHNDEDLMDDIYWKGHEAGKDKLRPNKEVLIIKCNPNNNRDLPIKYSALILEATSQKVLANVSNSSVSEFYIKGLKYVSDLDILIHSINSRGKSDLITVQTRTSIDIAEKRTAQVRHLPSQSPILETQTTKNDSSEQGDDTVVIPVLAVAIGVLGSLGLIAIVSILLIVIKRNTKCSQIMTVPSSLAESPDSNADIVPGYGANELAIHSNSIASRSAECSPLCHSASLSHMGLTVSEQQLEVKSNFSCVDTMHQGSTYLVPSSSSDIHSISYGVCNVLPTTMTQQSPSQNPLCTSRPGMTSNRLISPPQMYSGPPICTIASQCQQMNMHSNFPSLCSCDSHPGMNANTEGMNQLPPPVPFQKTPDSLTSHLITNPHNYSNPFPPYQEGYSKESYAECKQCIDTSTVPPKFLPPPKKDVCIANVVHYYSQSRGNSLKRTPPDYSTPERKNATTGESVSESKL